MAELNKYFTENNITVTYLPAKSCEKFTRYVDNKSLRLLVSGGENLNKLVLRSYKVINAYGPTEYTVNAAKYEISLESEEISIGRPVANT